MLTLVTARSERPDRIIVRPLLKALRHEGVIELSHSLPPRVLIVACNLRLIVMLLHNGKPRLGKVVLV